MKKSLLTLCLLVLPLISCQAEEVQMIGPCEPYELTASMVEQNDVQYTLAFAHGNERIYVDRSSCHRYTLGQETVYACIAVRILEEEEGETCTPFVMQFQASEGGWQYQEEEGPWIPIFFLTEEQKDIAIEDMGYAMYVVDYHVVATEVLKKVFAEVEGGSVTGDW